MKLRPSSLPIFMKCSGSVTLPSIEETTPAMQAGTERHKKLAADPSRAADVLASVGLPTENIRTEVELTWAGVKGTADVVSVNLPELTILDWKGPWSRADCRDQLMWYAAAAINSEMIDVETTVNLVIANVDDDLDVTNVEVEKVGMHELGIWQYDFDNQREETPRLVVGDHCAHCSSFRACPAQVTLVNALATTKEFESLTTANAGIAWEKLNQYKAALSVIEDTLRSMATDHDIPLPNGRVLGRVEVPRETIDASAAVALIPELTSKVKWSITKSDVTKAELVQLRAAGATKTTLGFQVKEHK